jgi:hypothetical protein
MQHKCTYRFTDKKTDKKIKLMKEMWGLKSDSAVVEKLVDNKKI